MIRFQMIRFMDDRHPLGGDRRNDAREHNRDAADGGAPQEEVSYTPPGRSSEFRRMERLGDEIASLAAYLHAATHRLLVRIREFDDLFEKHGGGAGFRSTADWLAWRTSMSRSAARERVRVARALADLPLVSRAMARGELSFSKVRAIARAVPVDRETEETLLHYALHGTATHLERLVRAWRRVGHLAEDAEERARHARRYLTVFPDEDGSWVIRGRLDPEVGALVRKALDMGTETLYRRERDAGADEGEPEVKLGSPDPAAAGATDLAQRRADALGLVAEAALRSGCDEHPRDAGVSAETRDGRVCPDTRADRFQVVLHVDLETLRKEKAAAGLSPSRFAYLDDHVGVSAETARRLACDAGRVVMTHDSTGNVLDVGRKTRTIPPALARAVAFRDGGRCRFPGCSAPGRENHHVEHWATGGKTKLDNVALLCWPHHRAVHEGGFEMEGTEGGGFRFRWPDGRIIPQAPRPAPVRGDPVARLVDQVRRGLEKEEEGHRIGPWTATPDWDGRPPDLNWALSYLPPWGKKPEAEGKEPKAKGKEPKAKGKEP